MEYVYPKKKQKTVLCASSAANVFGSVFTILMYSEKNIKDIQCGSYLIHLFHLIPLFKPLKLINVHC